MHDPKLKLRHGFAVQMMEASTLLDLSPNGDTRLSVFRSPCSGRIGVAAIRWMDREWSVLALGTPSDKLRRQCFYPDSRTVANPSRRSTESLSSRSEDSIWKWTGSRRCQVRFRSRSFEYACGVGSASTDFVLISCAGVPREGVDLATLQEILLAKRVGEAMLRNSGMAYTIVRPTTLVDEPGGLKALVFDQVCALGPFFERLL